MALLDKLGSLAKSATDKANDTIEITRLATQISSLENKIAGIKNRLGEHVWLQYKDGDSLDETSGELCAEITGLLSDIEQKRAQIQALKGTAQQEAPPAAAASPVCAECGAGNQEGAKFCRECGAKMEQTPSLCPACGIENPPGTRFCGECGARLD